MKILIFSTTLLGARTLILPLAMGMLALQAIVSYTYESFSGITEQLFENIPREFEALTKIQSGMPLVNDPNAYVTLGYSHPIFLVLGSVVAITLGSQALAGEVDRGTILYLLARPLPRWQVVLSKGGAILPATALVAAGAVSGTFIGKTLFNMDVEVGRFVLAAINAWALFTAIGSVSLLCSALANSSAQAAAWGTSFALISFFIDFLADLWEPVRKVEPLSIFNHFDPSLVVTNRSIPANDLAFLVVLAALATMLAIFVFSHRDVRV